MLRKSMFAVSAFTLALISTSVSANWQVTGGFTNLSDDSDGFDVSLSAITAGLAYEIGEQESQFTITPELKIGLGVDDDTIDFFISDIKVEIERYIAISARGTYYANDSFYIFAQPTYANLKTKATLFGESESDDEWELGAGIGIGFQTSENFSLEVSYENFDGTDAISGGFRYRF